MKKLLKQPKLKVYEDGGPIKPDWKEYMEWIESNTDGTENPYMEETYNKFLAFKGTNPNPEPFLKNSPLLSNIKQPAKQPTFTDFQVNDGEGNPENHGFENYFDEDKEPINWKPLLAGSMLVGAGLNKLENQQRLNQENQLKPNWFKPYIFQNNNKYGTNRNSQNLSVSDTAIAKEGMEVGQTQLVNVEKGEIIQTPDGLERIEGGFRHSNPKNKVANTHELPIGTKIFSRSKPLDVPIDSLNKITGVNGKETDTPADYITRINKKYKNEDLLERIQNPKYNKDPLTKATSELNQKNINSLKDIIFDIQELSKNNQPQKTMKNGGLVKGGEYELDDATIEELLRQGYKIEY